MGSPAPVSSDPHPIIFFDGVCNLCNAAVQFVIKRDSQAKFRFASLQSDYARSVLPNADPVQRELYSIILLKDGRLFERSDAVLEIARELSAWRWLYGFRILPRVVRDFVYKIIASNRYRMFGKRDSCMLPTPELKDRFLG